MRYFLTGNTIEDANPDSIRAQARQLSTVVGTIDRVADMLQRMSTGGVWESPAGDEFAAEVGSTPGDLVDVANRLRSTAQIIRPYADELEASQKALQTCDDDAYTAHTTMDEKDEQLRTMSPDDPDRPRVEGERGRAAIRLNREERRFERITADARADESRMAAKLHEACGRVGDPVLYDYLETLTNAGGTAKDAGIIARPIALAGVAEPIGLAGRRIVYDEGSYAEVATSSAGFGLDTVSFGAGRVVKHAKQRFGTKEVSRVSDLDSKPVRIKDNPIITPGRGTSRTATAARTPSTRSPTRHDTPLPSKVPASVRDIARRKSGVDDLKTAFDDWEVIAGEGRIARAAVVVQHSAKHGNRVRRNAATTKKRADEHGVSSDGREQSREQRRKEETAEGMTEDPVADPRRSRLR